MRPGIADADGDGRCRLDAMARWLQDIAYADLIDAGFEGEGAWIVRRTRIRVEAFPRFGEDLFEFRSGDKLRDVGPGVTSRQDMEARRLEPDYRVGHRAIARKDIR
jgi:hypothetical protein